MQTQESGVNDQSHLTLAVRACGDVITESRAQCHCCQVHCCPDGRPPKRDWASAGFVVETWQPWSTVVHRKIAKIKFKTTKHLYKTTYHTNIRANRLLMQTDRQCWGELYFIRQLKRFI